MDWKPKDAKEVLDDAIGSAINDNSTYYREPISGMSSEDYLPGFSFDKTIQEAVALILESKYLTITFKKEPK